NSLRTQRLEQAGIFPAEFFAPYIHTVGTSGNYSDETFTQTVFRYETVYDFGLPFFDVAKETTIDRPALPGIRRKNMWKGMIAFDRPTWIKPVNKKSTVFITGQFFWHYLVNNPSCHAQTVANLPSAALLRHAEGPQHAHLRDLGPRRLQQQPLRDRAGPHLPVLGTRRRAGRD